MGPAAPDDSVNAYTAGHAATSSTTPGGISAAEGMMLIEVIMDMYHAWCFISIIRY